MSRAYGETRRPEVLAVVLVACVASLDALEYQFEATRAVHLVHNFPDILGYDGAAPGRLLGGTMAAASGAACCAPAVLALLAMASMGLEFAAWVPAALLSSAALVAALILALAARAVRASIYAAHRVMYAAFAGVLVLGITEAACRAAACRAAAFKSCV